MNSLDQKINTHFAGMVVRKDLVKLVKGNAIVPSYVLEYLLGQYCATSDTLSIDSGIETVKSILAKHYVHRNESGLVRSNIKEKGRYKVIDKISASLNDKDDVYEAEFSNLGVKKILVQADTIKAHPKLLVSGVWCIAELDYQPADDKSDSPWILSSLKPIQLSHFDLDTFLQARLNFTTDEWVDLLIQSIGFNPEMFGKRSKMLQLARLIPFCERNYNLMELGPKGTGKSHIYSEFSPHGMLISGGEITVPKLFVNNSNGKIGLVGYWDTVAFDEFAGKDKRVDKSLVDIMKNYMANKSFSRGVETLGADASMVFVGNTSHSVEHMLKHSDLFCDLPDKFHDSAFLDRIHFYIPGWEVDIIRGEMFSSGFGFVVDYLAEVLRDLRNQDHSDRYKKYFTLSSDLSTRDLDGINKTFSGMMKIVYPGGDASKDQIEELLSFSTEGRKRVKDQLLRIDQTYEKVRFSYSDQDGNERCATTLEEQEFPEYYHRTTENSASPQTPPLSRQSNAEGVSPDQPIPRRPTLKIGHVTFQENQKGVCYDSLFGSHLSEASKISVTDPYVRKLYQVRNFMELVETIARFKPADKLISLNLITVADDFNWEQQVSNFENIYEAAKVAGIEFTWEFDQTGKIHARHIVTDQGWKISLDRGLDIFQHYEMNNMFAIANRLQQHRACKAFEVTYILEQKL
jgi:ATP-dependent Lon protease